jgi:hypothetical protein
MNYIHQFVLIMIFEAPDQKPTDLHFLTLIPGEKGEMPKIPSPPLHHTPAPFPTARNISSE